MRRLIYSEWFLLLAIAALAAALRFYALDKWPPGLYRDEAYNGLDALNVIRGARPIFFEANNGREPLFIYLVALSVSRLGRSPLAIRLVSAILGTLTVPAAYLMAKEWLGRQKALLTALITATSFWHLNLSRVGFRTISLPFLTALCLWLFTRGLRKSYRCNWGLSGLCLGLSFYTYSAARFLPLVFLLLMVYWLWRRQSIDWRGLFLFFIVTLIIASPLLLYALKHPDAFLERSKQVSIFNPLINKGNLPGTFIRQVAATLGMFNWRGDFIPRHNMPYRPVFDPAMGLLFLLGLVTSLRHSIQRQEYALLLISWLVMLLPTVLAESAPHFLRAVGILPMLFVFPAVGLKTSWEALQKRTSPWAASLVGALLLGLSLCTTLNDYFFHHIRSENVYYNFETGAVELASTVNRFIGTGWHYGSTWRTPDTPPNSQHSLYLDKQIWHTWASIRYLVPNQNNIMLLGEEGALPTRGEEVWLIVWPYADYTQYLALLPREHLISVQEGPLERGDLEQQARLLCLIYKAAPVTQIPSNLQVQFEYGIELLGYEWSDDADGYNRLRLFWRANKAVEANYSVFVHLKQEGQIVAQSDSYPALGYYPTRLWRPGDIIADDHPLPTAIKPGEGYSISLGLYLLPTMTRLQVLDAGHCRAYADEVIISPL